MRTPICDQLGIEFPIFAFSHCRDVVAAVANAGGFGVLGALAFEPEQLEIELAWIDDHVDGRPYGVDFAMPASYVGKGGGEQASAASLRAMIPEEHWQFANAVLAEHGVPPLPEGSGARKTKAAGLGVDEEGPGQVDVSLAHPSVKLLVNALGPPPAYVVERAHAKGVLVGALAGSVEHARKQVEQGVDVIVAQGTEAGGHTGEVATMVLVPDVVDAVGGRVPVLAAGGIGSGRQMAAALALGAQGVWTGSIWLTVAESAVEPHVVEKLLVAGSRDAVRSRSMTGKPARQLRTAWTEAWERPGAPKTLPMPLQGILYSEMAHRFVRARDPELSGSPVGQIVSRMNEVRSSRDVVREMVEECVETLDRVNALFGRD
ncbi:MAG: nitronate monooxygenase [Myxococcales bacterium]|nr:nitronate monooxygenase [Myxococcales bacterium]